RSKRDGQHDDDSSLDSDINSAADSDSDDDDEDDNEEADVCPSGCDSAVYDGVLELRNRRLDMEEALGEIQKIVEESKKSHTRLLQKEKTLNKDQTLAEEKIQHFQANKQQKLNQLHRILSLKLSQIKCISVVEDNVESSGLGRYALLSGQTIRLPESLDEEGQVVFTNTALERLRQRIVDLHREKAEIRRQYRNLKMMYGARMRENKKINEAKKELERRLEDIQQLKFGQLVDIDDLEKSGMSREQEELGDRLRETELRIQKRLAKWEEKLKEERQVYVEVTRANTKVMEDLVKLGQRRASLDTELDARMDRIALDDEVGYDGNEIEYERMQDLLNMQRKEIVTLQAEIELFRRKGGHVFAMATSMAIKSTPPPQ
ncbi:conserved hypothetical protein, partial [Perkinsus marinus ATCC 50983]